MGVQIENMNVETPVLGNRNLEFEHELENVEVARKMFDDMTEKNFGVVEKALDITLGGRFRELNALKNIYSIKEYHETFIRILDRSQVSPEYGLRCFIDGLKEEIQEIVRLFKPQTFRDAYYLAKVHEITLSKTKPNDPITTTNFLIPRVLEEKSHQELNKSISFYTVNTNFQVFVQSDATTRIQSQDLLNL